MPSHRKHHQDSQESEEQYMCSHDDADMCWVHNCEGIHDCESLKEDEFEEIVKTLEEGVNEALEMRIPYYSVRYGSIFDCDVKGHTNFADCIHFFLGKTHLAQSFKGYNDDRRILSHKIDCLGKVLARLLNEFLVDFELNHKDHIRELKLFGFGVTIKQVLTLLKSYKPTFDTRFTHLSEMVEEFFLITKFYGDFEKHYDNEMKPLAIQQQCIDKIFETSHKWIRPEKDVFVTCLRCIFAECPQTHPLHSVMLFVIDAIDFVIDNATSPNITSLRERVDGFIKKNQRICNGFVDLKASLSDNQKELCRRFCRFVSLINFGNLFDLYEGEGFQTLKNSYFAMMSIINGYANFTPREFDMAYLEMPGKSKKAKKMEEKMKISLKNEQFREKQNAKWKRLNNIDME